MKESKGRNFENTAHAGLQEHQMANLCLHAICPQGYMAHVHRSGTHCSLSFPRWIAVPCKVMLEAKCERFTAMFS